MKPSTWLPASPMNTAARRPGRRLKGRKPTHAKPSDERKDEHDVVLVSRGGVDGEVTARDRRERRCETVHVVQQVEGVRDAHEPDERDAVASRPFPISSTRRPAATRERPPRRTVRRASRSGSGDVDRPPARPRTGSRSRPRMPSQLPVASTAPTASAQATPAKRPQGMPTPPNVGVGRVVPALAAWGARRSGPSAYADRSSTQSTRAATGRAAIVTAALTRKG